MSSLIFPLTVHRSVSIVENQMRNSDPNARVNFLPLGLELNKDMSTIWTNPNGTLPQLQHC